MGQIDALSQAPGNNRNTSPDSRPVEQVIQGTHERIEGLLRGTGAASRAVVGIIGTTASELGRTAGFVAAKGTNVITSPFRGWKEAA